MSAFTCLPKHLPLDVPPEAPSRDFSGWAEYFDRNSAEPSLPWSDGRRLSGAERAAVLASIQQFQLGENAGGRRLLRRAEAFARRRGDSAYVGALRLFIREEQRHSRLLGRFLAAEGAPCLSRHWIHGAFRWVRGLAGLELFMRVLSTAEAVAMPYYGALRDATGSFLLRALCDRILQEEAAHLRFQALGFQWFERSRPRALRFAVRTLHRWFLAGTAALVWLEHRPVFRAAGFSYARVRRESLAAGDVMFDETDLGRA